MKPLIPNSAATGLLAAMGVGLAAMSASAQPALEGVTLTPGQLLSIDGGTGAASQYFPVGTSTVLDGLAAYGNGLYTYDAASGDLLDVDPMGNTLSASPLGITAPVAPGGLAINGSGVGFLADPLATSATPASALYEFNLAGGPARQVSMVDTALSSLAFGPTGTLYGLGQGDGNLFTVDPTTGVSTLVGSLGIPSVGSSIGALTFADGSLFASVDDNLYTVDPATGAGTEVNPALAGTGFGGGFSGVSGLAPAAAPAVPEPGSLGLFAAGLLPVGLLALRRRKA